MRSRAGVIETMPPSCLASAGCSRGCRRTVMVAYREAASRAAMRSRCHRTISEAGQPTTLLPVTLADPGTSLTALGNRPESINS